ncbi:hypothetical protein OBBRIDRAFT_97321 [Obba rivulosa]|uniref:Uncharacterized protein n=1 Tax=Obba rivulosa TaxID=1052685 RepID=A0A8E2APY4_9APHY|nr:hypothetical protein OBBRIDRAFT_97321 [Obba rivulosa]
MSPWTTSWQRTNIFATRSFSIFYRALYSTGVPSSIHCSAGIPALESSAVGADTHCHLGPHGILRAWRAHHAAVRHLRRLVFYVVHSTSCGKPNCLMVGCTWCFLRDIASGQSGFLPMKTTWAHGYLLFFDMDLRVEYRRAASLSSNSLIVGECCSTHILRGISFGAVWHYLAVLGYDYPSSPCEPRAAVVPLLLCVSCNLSDIRRPAYLSLASGLRMHFGSAGSKSALCIKSPT